MHRVFVYGTLKRGFAEHDDLLTGAEFLGTYSTQDAFPLVLAGPERLPVLLSDRGSGHRVAGEVYDVTESMLERLDRRILDEDDRRAFRVMIPVVSDAAQHTEAAWAYVRDPEMALEIHGPPISEYTPDAHTSVE